MQPSTLQSIIKRNSNELAALEKDKIFYLKQRDFDMASKISKVVKKLATIQRELKEELHYTYCEISMLKNDEREDSGIIVSFQTLEELIQSLKD